MPNILTKLHWGCP